MPATANSGIDSPRAWIIVLAAFFVSFVGFGVMYTFGVFLKPIGATFGASHATMTAIFSTLTVLSFFLAPLTGDLADRIGPRYVVGAGALLMGGGLLLTARTHYFPLIFVTWGGMCGRGSGLRLHSFGCGSRGMVQGAPRYCVGHRYQRDRLRYAGGRSAGRSVDVLFGWRTAFEIFGWSSMAILVVCAALLSRPPILRAKDTANIPAMMRTRTFYPPLSSPLSSTESLSTVPSSFCPRSPWTLAPATWPALRSSATSAQPASSDVWV